MPEVNDVQSRLNLTPVRDILRPRTLDEVCAVLGRARDEGLSIAISGGRHAMGGQQFARDALLLDVTGLDRILELDRERGWLRVEAGAQWPAILGWLHREQEHAGVAGESGKRTVWGIRQKQTGVDEVTVAGTLAANGHGRGLAFPPFSADVESVTVVDPAGRVRCCSRSEDSELFSLVLGGYGLFGVVVEATLRLVPRCKVRREVETLPVRGAPEAFARRIAEGFLYGDCQYATYLDMPPEEHPGILSAYRPVEEGVPLTQHPVQLTEADWADLYRLARRDKPRAFEIYSAHYRSTHGQVYWSDLHQLAGAFSGHRRAVESDRGTEMITEAFVRPEAFVDFMAAVRADFAARGTDMTYGTIRRIERDEDSFLAWATEPWLCIVCNLHVRHTEEGLRRAREEFQLVIDRAIEHGGSFFLTYHRWARPDQLEACYPRMREFLRLKRRFDPRCIFQSDWWRHWERAFGP